MRVPGSGFRVPGSCSGFPFEVHGSGFSGSWFIGGWNARTRNSEPGTWNLEPELRTRTRNQEPGTRNCTWQ
jgi:hypothetical protein